MFVSWVGGVWDEAEDKERGEGVVLGLGGEEAMRHEEEGGKRGRGMEKERGLTGEELEA